MWSFLPQGQGECVSVPVKHREEHAPRVESSVHGLNTDLPTPIPNVAIPCPASLTWQTPAGTVAVCSRKHSSLAREETRKRFSSVKASLEVEKDGGFWAGVAHEHGPLRWWDNQCWPVPLLMSPARKKKKTAELFGMHALQALYFSAWTSVPVSFSLRTNNSGRVLLEDLNHVHAASALASHNSSNFRIRRLLFSLYLLTVRCPLYGHSGKNWHNHQKMGSMQHDFLFESCTSANV